MKVSREQFAQNRQRILETAGKLFRERGFEGIGVADIMKSVGLTHGGFYGHFSSKDELIARAAERALATGVARWSQFAERADTDGLAALVDSYLSAAHRENVGGGCAYAALGSEVPRHDKGVRAAFTQGVRDRIEALVRLIPGRSRAVQRRKALATLSGLVGTLMLSRAVDDPHLSDEILGAGREAFGGSKPDCAI